MLSHGIPPVIVAGMLGHSLAILMTTYAHLARFARYSRCARNIPGTQDKAARLVRKSSSLGFAAKYAAQLMDEILTPIPIDLRVLGKEKS